MPNGIQNYGIITPVKWMGKARSELASWARALRHSNYRLYFSGQIISLLGTWMQKVALMWLMWKLTDATFYVGLTVFAEQIPIFFISPVAGVMADWWSRKKILLWTQSLLMLQAILLAILAYTGVIQPWHIVVLSAWLGVVRATDVPARQAFVVQLIGDVNDLPNAIALGSMSFNTARLVGPSLAGLAIAGVKYFGGEAMPMTKQMAVCFAVNALTFVAVIWSISCIKAVQPEKRRKPRPVFEEIREGFAYAHNFKMIRMMLIMMGFMGLFGMTYHVMLPVFADKILKGGATQYGYLQSSVGLGAICGAIFMASRKSVVSLQARMMTAMALFGISLAATAANATAGMCAVTLAMMGFGVMVFNSSTNTILQTVVDDDKRGRVMSMYVLALNGAAPIGGLIAGYAADKIGVRWTMGACGAMVVAGAFVYWRQLPWLKAHARPIYIAKGILPEMEEVVEAAEPEESPVEDVAAVRE